MKKKIYYGLSALVLLGAVALPLSKEIKKTYDERQRQQVQQAIADQALAAEAADQEVIKRGQPAVYDNFYYKQLTIKERADYIRLVEALRRFDTKSPFVHTNVSSLRRVYLAVSYDLPEFYWLSEVKEFDFSKLTYPDKAKETYDQIQQLADEVIAQMPEGSDYDKVKYFYDYVIHNTQYNLDAVTNNDLAWDNQSVRSVFLDKLSVCAGYSRAFQLLCQKAGIPCLYVVGDITVYNETHAWNLVRIDGNYYPVDTTWGDPTFDDRIAGQVGASINYGYLCTPRELFHETHTPWTGFFDINGGELRYPALAANALNYYALKGAYFETFDRNQLLTFMRQQEGREISFQLANKEAYQAALAEFQSDTSLVHEAFYHQPNYKGYHSIGDEHTYQITIKLMD